jgi:hypothetical protein
MMTLEEMYNRKRTPVVPRPNVSEKQDSESLTKRDSDNYKKILPIALLFYNPLSWLLLYIVSIPIVFSGFFNGISSSEEGNYIPILISSIMILVLIVHMFGWKLINKQYEVDDVKRENAREIIKVRSEVDFKIKKLENEYKSKHDLLDIEYNKKNSILKFRENRLDKIIASYQPFVYSASLCADMKMYIFDDNIYYLRHKKYPAKNAADTVKAMKKEARDFAKSYNEMLYKYEFLLNVFPELLQYVDNDESLLSLCDLKNYDDFEENRDRVSDFVSKKEWDEMDADTRNQLALDRYKKKPKSNWVIGIEYEMFVEYVLRENGYKTIPHGCLKGLEDLGRDVIAYKTDEYGNNNVYIIQCKNYSVVKGKKIHENVVCQTFGTAIEYQINHKSELFTRVVPVVYSTVPLSDTASVFAEKLGVVFVLCKKGDYPMIKCNIGSNGEKIYHLPFDQQYYRTEIKSPGEFYAWTVEEAVNAGFRRAFKYRPL